MSSKKVTISNQGKGLTSQAALFPVVKFLSKVGMIGLIKETVEHERGANALYDSVDAVFLTEIATIGGARALSSVATVWADGVLRRLAGWVAIPDISTLGLLFRTFRERQVSQLETLNHRLRGRFWRKALRSGVSTIVIRSCRVIDVDSTEKTAYGKQQGIKKGYNPFRKGKASYHPILAFCAETKEILQGWLGTKRILHQCVNWACVRRFIAVRQERKDEQKGGNGELFEVKEYDFFCHVTTEELTCWQTHKSYGKRATCETWIEESKNQMALGQIKMDDFWGSSAIFQCFILAYNTVRWMALCSGDKELCRWEPSTIRFFLTRVAGRLRIGSNQLGLNTPVNHLYPKQWDAWVAVGLG